MRDRWKALVSLLRFLWSREESFLSLPYVRYLPLHKHLEERVKAEQADFLLRKE